MSQLGVYRSQYGLEDLGVRAAARELAGRFRDNFARKFERLSAGIAAAGPVAN